MRRFRWLGLAVLLTFAGSTTCWFVPGSRYLVLGTINSEPFFDHKPLSYWIDLLGDRDPAARMRAAYAVGELGPKGVLAVPELCESLKDPEENVRIAAAVALVKMGDKASSATDALAECLDDPSAGVRMNAAIALARFGAKARSAVPALISAMTQIRNYDTAPPYSHSVREQVVRTLALIGPDAREATPVLIEALHDGRPGVRANAAFALGRIGPMDGSIMSQLRLALADDDEFVRLRASEAISSIDSASRPNQ